MKHAKFQSTSHGEPPATAPSVLSRPSLSTIQTSNLPSSRVEGLQANHSSAPGRPSQSSCAAPETPSQPPDFILKHSEPIDLGRLVGDPPDQPSPEYWTSFLHDLPTPELVHDLSPELQAMLFAQDRLRSSWTSPASLAPDVDGTGLLNPSTSSNHLLDALKSSRSPIILEELASQYSPHPLARTPVLDLAHKYQQFQHAFLPTPPNSASPVWSSTFSPYQGGLLSPEFLAAAGLSQLQFGHLPSQRISPQPFPKSVPRVSGNTGRKAYANITGPTAHIGAATAHKLPPRLAAEYARRHVEGSAEASQLAPEYSSSGPDLTNSPAMPKAPPNTPHSTATPHSSKRLDHSALPSLSVPCSPTSPRATQSLGFAQPVRSIPLSRLVQRRLSTVPEEDGVGGRENGPAALTYDNPGPASGLHLLLSLSGRQANNASLGGPSGTRCGIDDMGALKKALNISPDVKVPVKGSGPVDHCGAPSVKEASRRQGSNSTNNDGSRRGEGGRGRGQKRGGRGRKGRGATSIGTHGAERVDGGMVVKS